MGDTETISFTASGELAEWLREESEREMKTISAFTQDLVAEKVKEIKKQRIEGPEGPQLLNLRFESIDEARDFREEFETWLHGSDNHREKIVRAVVPEDRVQEALAYPNVQGLKLEHRDK